MRRYLICWLVSLASLGIAQTGDSNTARTQQSSISIKVSKSGLFSGLAHDHVIVAPITRAEVDPQRMSAEITVAVKEMKVMDKEVSDKDRAEIQNTMLGPKVLDAPQFPEIHFKSSRVEQTSPQHYRVTGTLELHGAQRELTLEVTGDGERYHGATKLKQSEFGIKPISLFGGSVKVKDELELEFDVYEPSDAKTEPRAKRESK